MDWEQLREKTLGEVGTSLVAEGAGVTAGFVGAAIVGRQIQNRVKADADIVSSTDKIMAWSSNNLPKVAMWYLLRRYAVAEPGEVLTPMKEATVDAKKAISGSIIYDTLIRLANGGKNPGDVKLWGYQIMSGEPQKSVQSSSQSDIQRLIQENSALRAELNKALQRLATPAIPPAPQVVQPTPQVVQQAPPPVVKYQPVTPPVVSYTPAPQQAPIQRAAAPIVQVEQRPPVVRAQEVTKAQPVPPAVSERERRYGFMNFEQAPPAVQERQREFGFMKAGEEKDIASMFGML